MNVLMVSDLTMSNGLTTSKSSVFELRRDSLSLLIASARLSDIPVWNSMPGRKLLDKSEFPVEIQAQPT